MNFKSISRNVGYALLVSALFMLISLGVSVLHGMDGGFQGLVISFILTFMVGIFPFIFVRGSETISLKDGYMIVAVSWLLSFVFGMLPYILYGGPFTFANALFECVSGYTTTGATILDDIEALPPSLLFWRASTHFIGGLGVVVFMLLIIPASSPIRTRLTSMELSDVSKSGYSTRSNNTVFVFTYVYLALTLAAFVAYMIAGMEPFDAVCHAFSVGATGGFSTKNLSIAGFGSPAIEAITVVFMVLGSIHFGLLFLCVVRRSLKPLNNHVVKFYLGTLVVFSLIMGLSLKLNGSVQEWGKAMWYGTFQTVSIASTTGFAIADNATWPMSSMVLMTFMALMCGCAGSTTCGLKADRVLVLIKAVGKHIDKALHPSSIAEVKMGGRVMRDDEVLSQILYIGLYGLVLGLSITIVLALGTGTMDAFSGSVASLGNIGPAIGNLGNMGNYNALADSVKFIFSIDMFLGRVEIYPVLAVLAMIFDHNSR